MTGPEVVSMIAIFVLMIVLPITWAVTDYIKIKRRGKK